jgi:VIT1/CCC1 family predicted Fe2+/Mn2+ transporter
MTSEDLEAARPPDPQSVADYSPEWIKAHIADERRQASILGESREIIFGAQDGLVSTLAVVATVAGAASSRTAVLVAGLASAVAGIFSMGIGEYMSSKSQGEMNRRLVAEELEEVRERPLESEAEVAYMFEQEGLGQDDARRIASVIAKSPNSLLSTMVSKELGLIVDQEDTEGSPLQGAVFMAVAFAVGSMVPVIPFLFAGGTTALAWATATTAAVLFAIGAVKARWTNRNPVVSGLEIVALAAAAGVLGYLFGTVLPELLGFSPAAA